MENKVLIKLIVPELEMDFDILIPVNEVTWKVKKMLVKSISDITNVNFNAESYSLVNKDNSKIYENNTAIIDTDIRNATELLLLSN